MPSWEEQKLRIFFSVDIVGSTEYKTRRRESHEKWWVFYQSFFEDFQTQFAGHLSQAQENYSKLTEPPSLWKLLGDEMLYTAVIKTPADAAALTKAFYRTLFEYDKTCEEQGQLRVKGTGWTAGFPIRNAEIRLKELFGKATPGPDYIGQDIDIGFRLGHTARAGRMTVSMDLAEVLTQDRGKNFDFYHVGWENLKGVFANHPYPVIWITEDDKPRMLPWEDFQCPFTKSFKEDRKLEKNDLIGLFKDIRRELRDLNLIAPYFNKDDMPEEHKEIWKAWKKEERLERKTDVLQGQGDDPLGTD